MSGHFEKRHMPDDLLAHLSRVGVINLGLAFEFRADHSVYLVQSKSSSLSPRQAITHVVPAPQAMSLFI